jgi:hypothetical protein
MKAPALLALSLLNFLCACASRTPRPPTAIELYTQNAIAAGREQRKQLAESEAALDASLRSLVNEIQRLPPEDREREMNKLERQIEAWNREDRELRAIRALEYMAYRR